jgi:glycosyltransferase involved in cell wall biosynthesis
MTLTLTVALCTRNGAAHVEEQLVSILSQSLSVDEIIVSDDASADNTVSIIHSTFTAHGNRPGTSSPMLRVIENALPLGVTANFEQAMRAASGDIVLLCDQDDVWHPERVRIAAERFAVEPRLEMLHADARLIDEWGAPLGYSLADALGFSRDEWTALRSGDEYRALLRRNLVTGATAAVRRELVERALPFPQPWVHDEWLGIIAAATAGLRFTDQQIIDYRQHSSNEIGVQRLDALGKVRRILQPRNDRNQYLYERARVLLTRLEALGETVPASNLLLARGKLEHQRFRSHLARSRPKRLLPVLREAATGRYSRFGRGGGDILRDLLQPAGDQSTRSTTE